MTLSDLVRRLMAVTLIAMGLGITTAVPAQSTAPPAHAAASRVPHALSPKGPALPATGAFFGANMPFNRMGTTTRDASRVAWETAVARPAAVERLYHTWDDVFPTDYEYEIRDLGQTPILSWGVSTFNYAILPYTDITAGKEDATIDARAADIKTYGAPIYLIFDHEPEGSYGGTAAEFVDAWRHIHDRFAADGVTNVSWVLTLLASHYGSNPDEWYPGDTYVDLLAADGYNWYGCPDRNDPWTSFESVFTDFHDYGVATGKPMMIAEWGTSEDVQDPHRKPAWIADAATTLKGWPEIKVVSYYDNGWPNTCEWWVDSSTASLSAFRAVATDPYFNPPPPIIMITSAPASTSTSASPKFTFFANRAATFSCVVDVRAPVSCTSPYSPTGLADGSHTLAITATDAPTLLSSTTHYVWTIDTTAPVLTVAYGPPAYSHDAAESLELISSDPAKPSIFTCSLDTAFMTPCGTWIDYVDLADGVHVFKAQAFDAAGNGSATVVVTWTVDTVAPTVTINTGPPPLSNSSSPTFTFSSNEPLATFSCSKDLAAYITCTTPKTYTSVSNGAHTLDVRANDPAGNISTSAHWSWTTDTAAPTVSITSPTNLKTTSAPTFTLTPSDTGSVMRCSLDSAVAKVCGTKLTYTNVALGSHSLSVYATDAAGNVGKTFVLNWVRLS